MNPRGSNFEVKSTCQLWSVVCSGLCYFVTNVMRCFSCYLRRKPQACIQAQVNHPHSSLPRAFSCSGTSRMVSFRPLKARNGILPIFTRKSRKLVHHDELFMQTSRVRSIQKSCSLCSSQPIRVCIYPTSFACGKATEHISSAS